MNTHTILVLTALSTLGLAACSPRSTPTSASNAAPKPTTEPPMKDENASIGRATMKPDGTITLMLRAEGAGVVGDGLLRYPPSHPQYQYILDHLAPMKPGDSKPVPPFPPAK